MVFIGFLLAKSYGKLLFRKNNAFTIKILMCFLNVCEKSKIHISF